MNMLLWEANWRQTTAAGFQRRKNSPLTIIVGALDGLAVRIEQACLSEVACTRDYCSWTGFFAMNVSAICYLNYEFL